MTALRARQTPQDGRSPGADTSAAAPLSAGLSGRRPRRAPVPKVHAPDALARCSMCGRDLPVSAFRLDAHGWVRSRCRACGVLENRAYKQRHRDRLLAERREAYHAFRRAGFTPEEASSKR